MQPPLKQRIESAKYDQEAMVSLMEAYRPLMIAAVRFHMHSVRDEYMQVASDAFLEAVHAYNPAKGVFLPLARRIISMRLIDERRRSRLDLEIPMADIPEDTQFAVEQVAAVDAYQNYSREEERREEINDYTEALSALGITLLQVQRACPRHETTRALCQQGIRFLVEDGELAQRTRRGRLPIAALCEAFGTSDKIWERHRRYIIAALVALDGNYPTVGYYIAPGREKA